jgi:hypothetical protein
MCLEVHRCGNPCLTLWFLVVAGAIKDRMVHRTATAEDWSFDRDTELCGSFGVFLPAGHIKCNGKNGHCCKMDINVAVHFHVMCGSVGTAELKKANGDKQFSLIRTLCAELHWGGDSTNDHVYATPEDADNRDTVLFAKSRQLNQLWDVVSVEAGSWAETSSSQYVVKNTVSEVFASLMQSETGCDEDKPRAFCASYHLPGEHGIVPDKLGGYYFGRYGLYEFPFAWWHKCMMLPSKAFQSSLAGTDRVDCLAWTLRIKMDPEDPDPTHVVEDTRWYLQKLDGGITTDMQERLRAEFKLDLIGALSDKLPSEDLKPQCYTKTKYVNPTMECQLAALQFSWFSRRRPSLFEDDVPDACWEVDTTEGREEYTDYYHNILSGVKHEMFQGIHQRSVHAVDFIETPLDSASTVTSFRYVPPKFEASFPSPTSIIDDHEWEEASSAEACTVLYNDVWEVSPTTFACAKPEDLCPDCLKQEQCELVKNALLVIAVGLNTKQSTRESLGLPRWHAGDSTLVSDDVYSSYFFDFVDVKEQIAEDYKTCSERVDEGRHKCSAENTYSPCYDDMYTPDAQTLAKTLTEVLDADGGPLMGIPVDENHISGSNLEFKDIGIPTRREDKYLRLGYGVYTDQEVIMCNDGWCAKRGEGRLDENGEMRQPWKFFKHDVDLASNGGTGPDDLFHHGKYFTIETLHKVLSTGYDIVDAALRRMAVLLKPLESVESDYRQTASRNVIQTGRVFVEIPERSGSEKLLPTPVHTAYGIVYDYSETIGNGKRPVHPDWPTFTNEIFTTIFEHAWDFEQERAPGLQLRGCLPGLSKVTQGLDVNDQVDDYGCVKVANAKGRWHCAWEASEVLHHVGNAAQFAAAQSVYNGSIVYDTAPLDWYLDDQTRVLAGQDVSDANSLAFTMYLSMLQTLLNEEAVQGVLKPVELQLYKMHKQWQGKKGYTGFDVTKMRSFDADVEALKTNQVCGENATTFTYGVPQNNLLYEDARIHYNTLVQKDAGSLIHPDEVLMWTGLSHLHSISKTLPTWSLHRRQERQVFGSWVFDSSQRSLKGSALNSVCYHSKGGVKKVMNPWVGGDFNPFELCDTETEGVATSSTSIVQELVSSNCNEYVCPGGGGEYWSNQPSGDCQNAGNRKPAFASIPKRVTAYHPLVLDSEVFVATAQTRNFFDNNMCVHQPLLPVTCNHPQGMLAGGRGTPMTDTLYKDATPVYDSILAEGGSGLFVRGGNVIYRTKTSVTDETHSILKQSKDDIGGHHVVLVLAPDPENDNKPHMYVSKLPLSYVRPYVQQATRYAPGVEQLLKFSEDSLPSTEWLSDVYYAMRAESKLADLLYPTVAQVTPPLPLPRRLTSRHID